MKPAFEVVHAQSGHRYQIYPDGQIEGFGDATLVINRIPQLLAEARVDETVEMAELKNGDRVTVKIPGKPTFNGLIVGEGRGREWWLIVKDGTKSKNGYAKGYCWPEVIR